MIHSMFSRENEMAYQKQTLNMTDIKRLGYRWSYFVCNFNKVPFASRVVREG